MNSEIVSRLETSFDGSFSGPRANELLDAIRDLILRNTMEDLISKEVADVFEHFADVAAKNRQDALEFILREWFSGRGGAKIEDVGAKLAVMEPTPD